MVLSAAMAGLTACTFGPEINLSEDKSNSGISGSDPIGSESPGSGIFEPEIQEPLEPFLPNSNVPPVLEERPPYLPSSSKNPPVLPSGIETAKTGADDVEVLAADEETRQSAGGIPVDISDLARELENDS